MAHATQERGYRFQSPMLNLGARPNVYRRSLEARDFTNAYLAEVERKAAGVDESLPVKLKWRVWQQAAIILLGVALCVGLWLSLT